MGNEDVDDDDDDGDKTKQLTLLAFSKLMIDDGISNNSSVR